MQFKTQLRLLGWGVVSFLVFIIVGFFYLAAQAEVPEPTYEVVSTDVVDDFKITILEDLTSGVQYKIFENKEGTWGYVLPLGKAPVKPDLKPIEPIIKPDKDKKRITQN